MDITLYTRVGCERCDRVKEVLNQHNLSYIEFIIDHTIHREEVVNRFPDAKILPIVTIDGTWIGGRDEIIKMINEGKLNERNTME